GRIEAELDPQGNPRGLAARELAPPFRFDDQLVAAASGDRHRVPDAIGDRPILAVHPATFERSCKYRAYLIVMPRIICHLLPGPSQDKPGYGQDNMGEATRSG